MATTSRYTLLGAGANFMDFYIPYGAISLDSQEIIFKGNSGVDQVYVGGASSLTFDFTQAGLGVDKIYLEGSWADYSRAASGSVLTVTRTSGGSEIVKAISGDTLVFADGTVSVLDALNYTKGTITTEPVPTGEASGQFPIDAAGPFSNTARAVVLDANGETIALSRPGVAMIVKGGSGVDVVYVNAGTNVDSTQLGLAQDKLYLTGNFTDYTGTYAGSVVTLTRTVGSDVETVKFLGGSTSAFDDIIFANGKTRSIDILEHLKAPTDPAKAVTPNPVETTPLPGPTVSITTNDALLKIGDIAQLTFTLNEASTDFTSTDVSVSGGALANFVKVNGTTYTATLSPTTNSTANATVSVASDAFTNADGQGNAANSLNITVDTIAPAAPVFNDVATDNAIDSTERAAGVTVTGTNEAGATVTLNGNATTAVDATHWSYTLSAAEIDAFGQGSETLTAVATDAAGNTASSTKGITVSTPSLSYSTTTFSESTANDGSITATSTLTLTNDTFTGTNGNALTGVTFSSVPAGLIASLVRNSDTTATLSFTGAANLHANANDVSNLTVSLSNATFTGGNAANVMGSTTSNLAIDFADPLTRSISYSGATFDEAAANDGSISTVLTLTLTGDTFTGTNGVLSGASVSNAPSGLTGVVTLTSDTTATVALTGNANLHTNANDIANLMVTLGNSAFTSGNASGVTNATKSNLAVDFDDPVRTVAYSGSTFSESNANDGSISNSLTLTLTGDTFKGADNATLTGASISNVPNGLTASIVKNNATTATLTLTGNAVAHANANDISNLTVNLSDASFTLGNAAGVTGASKSNLGIDFIDRELTYSTTTFDEASANDGSISTVTTITLTGDTFAGTNGQSLGGVAINNVPAGLTANIKQITATTAELSLTGNAASHLNVNDVSNLSVIFGSTAFTNGNAAGVIGATKSNLIIDFDDQTRAVSYNRTTFVEAQANDGTIHTQMTLTLSGDTFNGTVGQALTFTSTGLPTGLTASLVKASDTTATLTLVGNAAQHGDANDVSGLTISLGNGAFTLGNAAAVTGAINSGLKINFADDLGMRVGATGDDVLNGDLGSVVRNDILYGNGGQDVINGLAGNDTIDITDAGASSTSSAMLRITSTANGLDTVIGFKGGATASGGDVLDFTGIVNLTDAVALNQTLTSNFGANNVFVFTSSKVSIDEAAAAIALDSDVTAAAGYIVIADSARNGATTVYHSSDLAGNGAETALVMLSDFNIGALTSANFMV